MFGRRNYSRYSISSKSADDSISLSDAVKVNKLHDSQLSLYFNVIKHKSNSKQELRKRNDHFEEFKTAVSNTKRDSVKNKSLTNKDVKADVVKKFLKRYQVQPCKEEKDYALKPAMRRAPLKTIKTVGIEVPSAYKEQAIYALPKKKYVQTFVQITKPIRKEKPKKSVEIVEEEPKKVSQCLIEEQLQETKHEIDMATNQLEQIRNLLNRRRTCLSPVKEEMEEMEEKANLVRELVDKKCSPIQPRTQWTVKSWDVERTSQVKKNKLMSTLNNLNQRLQRIQEKYFNEPKIKYKSISDFIPPRSKDTIETLYRNADYEGESAVITNILKAEDESPYDNETLKYMHDLIKRTEKLTNVNMQKHQSKNVKTNDSILVLMPPKPDDFNESEPVVNVKTVDIETDDRNKNGRGILKKNSGSPDTSETVLEAPFLQESIIKSDFLMKEFNLNSRNKDFDLSKILLQNNDDTNSMENFKKNVRFSKQLKRDNAHKDTRLHSNIELALRNSLFIQDDKKLLK